MIRATALHDYRCAREGCGMNLISQRDRHNLKIVHPYSHNPYFNCIDEGRVFRQDLTFAGWWITRQEFVEKYQ